ncbi:MAG: hypothetical protein EOP45_11875 [Sphingobacteriaceae bacterium]|nr:MAG: hypothetical protein EOP45_11875 [Sphingobacteriaceae bacterium]
MKNNIITIKRNMTRYNYYILYIIIALVILAIVGGGIYGIVKFAQKTSSGSSVPTYPPATIFGPNYPNEDLSYINVGAIKLSNGKYQLFFSRYGGSARWLYRYIIMYNPTLGPDQQSAIAASTFDTEEAARTFISTPYNATTPNKAFSSVSSNTVEQDFDRNNLTVLFDVRAQIFLY